MMTIHWGNELNDSKAIWNIYTGLIYNATNLNHIIFNSAKETKIIENLLPQKEIVPF